MSHAGVAILVIAFAVSVGIVRHRPGGELRLALAVAAAAVGFQVLEIVMP